jgi:hypothetical protein
VSGLRWLVAFDLAAALLPFTRRRPEIAYAGFDPEPVPADWQAVEPRWDCTPCHSVRAAVEVPGGFKCLNCGATAPAEPQHLTLTTLGERA